MGDIKLFVCCHRQETLPKHPLLVPIQVGTALADRRFPDFLHDDEGDGISAKNRAYCELTAQYWAWKNAQADYYGFFHYRRFLYPDAGAKGPYRVEREPTETLLDKLGYGGFAELIRGYDLIMPKGENMYVPVRRHYADAPFHREKDLALAERIVGERTPEMLDGLDAYFSGTVCYFGNIFIMRRQVFQDYCAWLFPILEEFDRRADVSGYSAQERRVDGYLAERLLGAYYTCRRGELAALELPRVHFLSGKEYVRQKALNAMLPPGTRLRSRVKAMGRKGD